MNRVKILQAGGQVKAVSKFGEKFLKKIDIAPDVECWMSTTTFCNFEIRDLNFNIL